MPYDPYYNPTTSRVPNERRPMGQYRQMVNQPFTGSGPYTPLPNDLFPGGDYPYAPFSAAGSYNALDYNTGMGRVPGGITWNNEREDYNRKMGPSNPNSRPPMSKREKAIAEVNRTPKQPSRPAPRDNDVKNLKAALKKRKTKK